MFVLLKVDAEIKNARWGDVQCCRDSSTSRFAVRVADHLHAGRGAKRVIVHYVVDVIPIELRFELCQPWRDHAFLEFQPHVFPVELDAVHRSVGICRFSIAFRQAQFDSRVCVWCPAKCQIRAPSGICRMNFSPASVLVVVGVGPGCRGICVELWGARRSGDDLIVAIVAPDQQAAVKAAACAVEPRRCTLEADHAGAVSGAVKDRLRPLLNDYPIVGFGEYIGRGRIHAHPTTAENHFAIEENAEARCGHSAKYRVAVGTALADHREAGNVLEQIRSVVSRHRLPWRLRVGADRQRALHGWSGYDDGIEGGILGCKSRPGVQCGKGQRQRAEPENRNAHCVLPLSGPGGVRGPAGATIR